MLTSAFYNANRGREAQPVKAEDFQHFRSIIERFDEERFGAVLCKAFFWLNRRGLLPPWAVAIAPADKLQRNHQPEASLPLVKAWIAPGVVVFLPQIKEGKVYSPLVLVDEERGGWIQFYDIESKAKAQLVEIPEADEGPMNLIDVDLELSRLVT